MNEGLTGLERGGWVINDNILIFGWTIPLMHVCWIIKNKKNTDPTLWIVCINNFFLKHWFIYLFIFCKTEGE